MKDIQPQILAALIAGLIAIVVAILQFFSNRRLNRENEELKRKSQSQIESIRLQNELIQNIELAKQEHLKVIVNQTYRLRRALGEFKTILYNSDSVSLSDLKLKNDEIEINMDTLVNAYRDRVYLNSFLGNIVQGFIHDTYLPYSIFKESLNLYYEGYNDEIYLRNQERLNYLKFAFERVVTIVEIHEPKLKEFMKQCYSYSGIE